MKEPLWKPPASRVKSSNIYRFIREINHSYGTSFTEYEELYRWSVAHPALFWREVFRFTGIIASEPYVEVIDDPGKMIGAKWFRGCRLNFAENLLRCRDDRPALMYYSEDSLRTSLSFNDLYCEVAAIAASLKSLGIAPGDRVVGYMPNQPETVIGMLAATSLGAVWSSCSPDFGEKGVLDRFGQIRPRVLLVADGYRYRGRHISCLEKVARIVEQIPSIEQVIVVSSTAEDPDITPIRAAIRYADFRHPEARTIPFTQTEFMHPLYIMYSSGTTGLPKCMVQSSGGVLLNQLKELVLHVDLKRKDTIFYATTCGWMMWNWLVTSLAVGATVVLYDGSPFHPGPEMLWRMAERERITVFGTSAAYLAALRRSGYSPAAHVDLGSLRTLLSTGSPLSTEDFYFVYDQVKNDVQLSSISGGSDLNGCFAQGNPMGAVYAGELQCRALGMEVYAYDDEGRPVVDTQGELVCTAPFPSMPIRFWDDNDGNKYRGAYFSRYPGVWTHGDYITITGRGSMIIHGRSDATLNPGGVRIGTAEIYRVMENIADIADSVVVGQHWHGDIRVVLFVKMKSGCILTEAGKESIRHMIRSEVSPRHVPAKIISVPDIPYTLNMKKVELAIRNIIHGLEVLNKDALINPESLDSFRYIEELQTE